MTEMRPIRSYVRRSGRITAGQKRALAELWPRFGLDYPDRLDLDRAFGRQAPRVLEIGFGNGETLVELAASHPELDFIGIEVHEPGVGQCLMRAAAAGITNLRLICHDAIGVLEDGIAGGSLQRINLYFPDPWPKKRHHKRRILKPDFMVLAADRLELGGTLHIATDWPDYAEHIDELIASCDRFLQLDRREHAGDAGPERPRTRFEQRGLRQGHRIWDWRLERIS